MGAPIPLPAAFVGFRTDRAFLAVADRSQPVGRNSQLREKVTRRGRPAIAEAEVIFRRTALVAVSFNIDAGVGEIGKYALQRVGIGGERRTRVVANVVRIIIEKRVPKIRLNARFERASAGCSVP
jgi:hypothetical protein